MRRPSGLLCIVAGSCSRRQLLWRCALPLQAGCAGNGTLACGRALRALSGLQRSVSFATTAGRGPRPRAISSCNAHAQSCPSKHTHMCPFGQHCACTWSAASGGAALLLLLLLLLLPPPLPCLLVTSGGHVCVCACSCAHAARRKATVHACGGASCRGGQVWWRGRASDA